MFSYMRGACNFAKFTVYGVHMEKRYRNIYSNLTENYSISLKKTPIYVNIRFHARKESTNLSPENYDSVIQTPQVIENNIL